MSAPGKQQSGMAGRGAHGREPVSWCAPLFDFADSVGGVARTFCSECLYALP